MNSIATLLTVDSCTEFSSYQQALPCIQNWQRVVGEHGWTISLDVTRRTVTIGHKTWSAPYTYEPTGIVHRYILEWGAKEQRLETYVLDILGSEHSFTVHLTATKVLTISEGDGSRVRSLYHKQLPSAASDGTGLE